MKSRLQSHSRKIHINLNQQIEYPISNNSRLYHGTFILGLDINNEDENDEELINNSSNTTVGRPKSLFI